MCPPPDLAMTEGLIGNSLWGMSPRITTAHHLQVSHFTIGSMKTQEVEAEGSRSHDFPSQTPSFWAGCAHLG